MDNLSMGMYDDPKKVRAQIKAERKKLKAEQKAQRKEAKKREQEFAEREAELDVSGGGVASFLLTMLIVLMWLAIMCFLIRLDVGGFGSNVLGPILKDVPYINMILPESARGVTVTPATSTSTGMAGTEGEADGEGTGTAAADYGTVSDQGGYIRKLETELSEAQARTRTDAETIDQLRAEVARLQAFEQEQINFEAKRQQFYNDVIYNDNAPEEEAYAAYYEMIDPDAAEVLYKQVVQNMVSEENVEIYAKSYAAMKPKEAAALFDEMVVNGTEHQVQLAARILLQMSSDDRGGILGKMEPSNAAVLTDILEPNALPYPESSRSD